MPIWSLERLFDPPDVIERQGREKEAEVRYNTKDADDDPSVYQCRVCGWQAPQPRFCSECLAETMEPLPHETP